MWHICALATHKSARISVCKESAHNCLHRKVLTHHLLARDFGRKRGLVPSLLWELQQRQGTSRRERVVVMGRESERQRERVMPRWLLKLSPKSCPWHSVSLPRVLEFHKSTRISGEWPGMLRSHFGQDSFIDPFPLSVY